MNKTIQRFLDGIEDVHGWTLRGASQFSEHFKLTLVAEFIERQFDGVDIGDVVNDSNELLMLTNGHTIALVNELNKQELTIHIVDSILTEVYLRLN